MPECTVRDITIHYEEFGNGHPILFLHGWPVDHRHICAAFEPVLQHRKGWRRIYPDLPGMGETRANGMIANQDQVLNHILGFMDSVAPGERWAIAGISYGGHLARGIIHERFSQIDGLSMIVPDLGCDSVKQKPIEFQVIKEDAEFLAALKPEERGLAGRLTVHSMEILESYRKYYSTARAIADYEFLERLEKNYSFSFNVDELQQPFPAPTLVLTGRFDQGCGFCEVQQLLENYPRATFAVLDRAGHGLVMEQRALFYALASEWLDRVEEFKAQQPSYGLQAGRQS